LKYATGKEPEETFSLPAPFLIFFLCKTGYNPKRHNQKQQTAFTLPTASNPTVYSTKPTKHAISTSGRARNTAANQQPDKKLEKAIPSIMTEPSLLNSRYKISPHIFSVIFPFS
jgi:hypothetical protein